MCICGCKQVQRPWGYSGVARKHLQAIETHRTCRTTTTIMPELPQELIDRIIDHVDDTTSLKACSLVCSQWSPRSRKHLFVQVEFTPQKRPGTLVRLHTPRTAGAILPRSISVPIRGPFLGSVRLFVTLASLISPLRCRVPFPVLFCPSGLGDFRMALVYRPRIVDFPFRWLFPRECDNFDTGGHHCSSFNPHDVPQPLPTSL